MFANDDERYSGSNNQKRSTATNYDNPKHSSTGNKTETRFNDRLLHRRSTEFYDGVYSGEFPFYSKPPGIDLQQYAESPDPFSYESTQGENVDIYVLDSGLADHASELNSFKNAFANGQIKGWFFPRGPQSTTKRFDSVSTRSSGSESFHGTWVISKIIDEKAGYARKANIWMAAHYDHFEWQFIKFVPETDDKEEDTYKHFQN
ncbi:hypothetical protein AA313_de0202641 [Arthrobotrys entomopaga]|nr:hypothetical protein AA313_de0202641 [Arthrobotrys entomopaga]